MYWKWSVKTDALLARSSAAATMNEKKSLEVPRINVAILVQQSALI